VVVLSFIFFIVIDVVRSVVCHLSLWVSYTFAI
jgi:hypothetical protein